MKYLPNPKLKGSGIVDCIPQKGKCLLAKNYDCGIDCYFIHGWYDPTYSPIIPPKKIAEGKIVRFNSGHDSNLEKRLVLETAKNFDDFFFNTSLPRFDFPGPVVFTCNSKETNKNAIVLSNVSKNLMFVRFRVNSWNLDLAENVIKNYERKNVPVVLTFMRYYSKNRIPKEFRKDYKLKKSIIHNYLMIKKQKREEIVAFFKEKYNNIFQCGSYESSFCRDCGNCKKFYFTTKSLLSLTLNKPMREPQSSQP